MGYLATGTDHEKCDGKLKAETKKKTTTKTVPGSVYLPSLPVLCVMMVGVLEAGLSPLPVTAYTVMV